jgi:hypothetical protein
MSISQDNKDLISNPQVIARYQKEITRFNKQWCEHDNALYVSDS